MNPDDIPDDVWRAAAHVGREYVFATHERIVVARAIMAERERCALVAEGFEQTRDWVPKSLYAAIRNEVAARIRRGVPAGFPTGSARSADDVAAMAIERRDLP